MTVRQVLTWLRQHGSRKNVAGMARYGIRARKVLGVSMAAMQPLVGELRGDHALARALWRTGWHDARILAALIDDPAEVTSAQMDLWARDFDNWAICDTTCIRLFRRTPLAWSKIRRWAASPDEFVRRAAFALMASLAVHDRTSPDARFLPLLTLVLRHARDDRNFVKKAVSWALRSIGARSPALHDAAMTLARTLSRSELPSARWVGADALRDLSRPIVRARAQRRAASARVLSGKGRLVQ